MYSFHAFGSDRCWICGGVAALKLRLPDDECSLWTLPPAVEKQCFGKKMHRDSAACLSPAQLFLPPLAGETRQAE